MDALSSIFGGSLTQAAIDYFMPMVATAFAGVVAWGIVALRQFALAWVDAKHLSVLESALRTGVEKGLAGNMTPTGAAQVAVEYAKKSAPDAVKKLKASDEILSTKAQVAVARAAAGK